MGSTMALALSGRRRPRRLKRSGRPRRRPALPLSPDLSNTPATCDEVSLGLLLRRKVNGAARVIIAACVTVSILVRVQNALLCGLFARVCWLVLQRAGENVVQFRSPYPTRKK